MAEPSIWTAHLSPDQIDELVTASAPYRGASPVEMSRLSVGDVPLPKLAASLDELRAVLVRGRGFQLIRGLPATELGRAHAAAAFLLIGIHLGSLRSQNAHGDLLGQVKNVGLAAEDPTVRIYQTDERQTFHTDSSDVVGLLCLETAESGGESLLVSVGAIYNELLDTAPESARLLFGEVATDRRGEVPAGGEPFFRIPVLSWFDDALTVIYQRQYIDSASRFDGAPRFSDAMVDALDRFDDIANDSRFHIRMTLDVGDMQFVHNHSLLHDRTAFVDKPGSPRHLLRLWVSTPGDRQLPPIFATRYGSTTVGDRGGIDVT